MNIQVYYAKQIGVPFQEFQPENADYKKVWEGKTADLEINKILDDDKILEIIFDRFNLDRRPKGFPDEERALSIGDVVSIDYRAYLCSTIGWKSINYLDLQESLKN